MSTYYNFFVEVYHNGLWHNVDYFLHGADGLPQHQFLATISHSFLGVIGSLVHNSYCLNFEDLAIDTQQYLLDSAQPQHEDCVKLSKYFYLGGIQTLENQLNTPYLYEGYITRNQLAALEAEDYEYPDEILTARDVLALPEDARSEYVLHKWDAPVKSRGQLRKMIDRVHDQVDAFNRSIPFRKDVSVSELKASKVRILYCIS